MEGLGRRAPGGCEVDVTRVGVPGDLLLDRGDRVAMRGVVVGEQPDPARRGDLEAAEEVWSSTDVDSMPNGPQVGRPTLRFNDKIGRRIGGTVVEHHPLGVLVQLGQDDLKLFLSAAARLKVGMVMESMIRVSGGGWHRRRALPRQAPASPRARSMRAIDFDAPRIARQS